MGADDWFEDRFGFGVDDIARIVTSVCRRLGWLQHASDIAAEVMARIYLRDLADPEFFKKMPIGRFVYTEAWFELMHVLRKPRLVEFRDPQQLPDPGYETDIEEKRLLSLLADCKQAAKLLADADLEIQEVFRLHCEGMSGKDIGQKLGLDPWTVTRRCQAALKRLRRTLSETDFGGPAHGGHQG